MFSQIFLFEIRYRLRRPAFYIYFILVFGFSTLAFAQGNFGTAEKEVFNSPHMLAGFCATMTIFLMLVSSAIMGTPLYRDLEHNTKEYYLAYPITKAGYFWGRFLGSFVFVLLAGLGVVAGARLGTALGPVIGWKPASHYGPNKLSYYLNPFFILIIPTLFFTSALFFGLVAIFRNVKVIYSSGLFFFLGYILSNFAMHNVHSDTVIYLSDPFLQNAMRMSGAGLSGDQLNHDTLRLTGLVLSNRLLWAGLGAAVLAFTWWRFSFERFFSGKASKDKRSGQSAPLPVLTSDPPHIQLQGPYYRRTLASLIRIELLNIIRDNYFWIILSGGYIFLIFVFWHGPGQYDVHDYPRTVFFVDAFTDVFTFFVFLIIIFYTGEAVHREKLT
ncbi:MAG TPA: ABC transporter permease subunit, partial [Puia sp.]|nr:ABC transporter permease subunit [Puia sp.]